LICKWADDSQRFILQYFDMIDSCPSMIYHNALPFSPSKSWLHEYYTPQDLHVVQVVKGNQDNWGACSRTVLFDNILMALACTKDIIAVGTGTGNIITVDAITGVQMSVLSGHTSHVNSVAFSSDGTFLVSGSLDRTIKLWDVQTGGVIKTLYGHIEGVSSVAISPDQTTIASASNDRTIHLWNVQTGDCCDIPHEYVGPVRSIQFSPSNSQLLMSVSPGTIQQWHTDGHQLRLIYEETGNGVAFSLEGTYFVSWWETVATVKNTDSGEVITQLQIPRDSFECCCFSPNDKIVVGSAGHAIYVWDITGSGPHLIETLVGHTEVIGSLAFSSSLISLSWDGSIKFWQIGTPTDSMSTLSTSDEVLFVSLQADDGIALSMDGSGVVTAWDISTGLSKTTFHTPVKQSFGGHIWLINTRLIVVWHSENKWCTWDTEKTDIKVIPFTSKGIGLRMSGDKSIVFGLDGEFVLAWSIQKRRVMSHVWLGCGRRPVLDSLIVNGSKVWVSCEDSKTLGWDFGISGSNPVPLSNVPPVRPPRPYLDFVKDTNTRGLSSPKVEDTITGREVFRLAGKYAKPSATQWDGRYLIAGYESGEVLILDCIHILLGAVQAGT